MPGEVSCLLLSSSDDLNRQLSRPYAVIENPDIRYSGERTNVFSASGTRDGSAFTLKQYFTPEKGVAVPLWP
jgi:hypothetical protein